MTFFRLILILFFLCMGSAWIFAESSFIFSHGELSSSDNAMTFDSYNNDFSFINGNVGIGTPNPTEKLVVLGTVSAESFKVTTTNTNLFLGYQAGNAITSGSHNLMLGYNAGLSTTTGSTNVFLGKDAGYTNLSGDLSVFLGALSGYSGTDVDNSVFLGFKAGYSTTADGNTFVGYEAGRDNAGGWGNVFMGEYAGHSNTYADENTYIGSYAGVSNEDGNKNVMIGRQAGYYATGGSNVFLGYKAGYNETGDNKLYIDNSDTSSPLIHGDFSENVVTINGDLNVTGRIQSAYIYSMCLIDPDGEPWTTQTTNKSSGDHVKFDSEYQTYDPNGDIDLDTSTSYSNSSNVDSIGRVTLKAGRTYKITGYISYLNGTSYAGFSIYDADAGSRVGTRGGSFANTNQDQNADSSPSIAFVTPSSDTRYELRITGGGAGNIYSGNNNLSATYMLIESW